MGCEKLKNQLFLLIILFVFILSVCGTVSAANNTTSLVSVSNNGGGANGHSSDPAISGDGRYIAFSSSADNLVNGDNNSINDIFVRDRLINTTERVTVSSTCEEGNGYSFNPAISADGRYVAFTSYANNLVVNDTNGCVDVFVRDRLLNTTERVSVSSIGEKGNGDSFDPSISGDGRFIAFSSYGNNLVNNDNNGFSDIFVYDRFSNNIKRVNMAYNGDESDSDSYEPAISADGNFVAFTSYADNLVYNDTNEVGDVFVFNQNLKTIKMISVSSTGEEGNGYSFNPSISADGRFIAFSSGSDNLVYNDTNLVGDIFVHDQISGAMERVSVCNEGSEFHKDNYAPSISGDGRYIAFVSGTIKPSVSYFDTFNFENVNDNVNILVYDRTSKIIQQVSVSIDGGLANSNSENPSISGDGCYIAFSSSASNLVIEDNNPDKIFLSGV